MPAYRNWEQKLRGAEAYRRDEGIPWTVVVDDLEGTVQRAYGMLADPTYLIDRDDRVAFYNMVTSAPALHKGVAALLAQGGQGTVLGGWNRRAHLGPALTAGWPAIRRGLSQSFTDLMLAAPGSPIVIWLGHQFRPILAQLTLRSEPLPRSVRTSLLLGAAAILIVGIPWIAAGPQTGALTEAICNRWSSARLTAKPKKIQIEGELP